MTELSSTTIVAQQSLCHARTTDRDPAFADSWRRGSCIDWTVELGTGRTVQLLKVAAGL